MAIATAIRTIVWLLVQNSYCLYFDEKRLLNEMAATYYESDLFLSIAMANERKLGLLTGLAWDAC